MAVNRPGKLRIDTNRPQLLNFQRRLQLEALEDRQLLTVVSWDGGGDHASWNDPLNWSGDALPGAGDDVVIDAGNAAVTHSGGTDAINSLSVAAGNSLNLSGGSLSIAAASSIAGTLALAGVLTGSGDVTVTGTLNWTSGGSMSGTGHTIIDLGAQMSITTPDTSVALSRTLDILGSATWWGYYGISMTGAVINNHGTFTNDTTYNNAPIFGNGPGNVFNNYGTFVNRGYMTFAAGSGGEMLLNNYGTVDCQAGYLQISAGGTSSGTFTGAAGSTLEFQASYTYAPSASIDTAGTVTFRDGTHTFAAGQFNPSGPVTVDGNTADVTVNNSFPSTSVTVARGTLALNASQSLHDLTVSGLATPNGTFLGILTGSGDVTVTGTFNWTSGGAMSGTGHTIIDLGAQMSITTPNTSVALSRTLDILGSATWWGYYGIGMTGAVINNHGTFTNDTTYNNAPIFGSGPGNVFNNYGTFVNRGDMTFAAGSGGEMLLNNYATVDCQAGYLQISAGGTSSGTFTGAAGSTLEFQASYTYAPSALIDTAGTVTFRDGTHTFAPGQFNPSGPVVVDGNIADVTVNNSFPSTSVTVARGTLTLNASQSLHDLTVSGLVTPSGTVYSGILTGSGDVTVTGTLNWTSGGSMSGTGHTIIDLGAQMSITTPNTSVALSRTLDILGSATWWGYYGISMTGAVINNHGTFTNDTTYNNAPIFGNGPGNVFNNYGTFVNRGYMTFAAGSGGEMLLNNYGTVDCQAGYLQISAGGTSSGTLTGAAGSTLEFQASYTYAPSALIDTAGTVTFRDGTHTFAPGQFNPSGPVVVDGNTADVTVNNSFPSTSVTVARGTLALNASQSLHDLTVSGLATPNGTFLGILTGSGDVTVTGTFNWTSGGAMSGTGHTIIDLGAQMSITTPNTSVALSRTLDILGSATWWGYYGIGMTGAVINNHGTFTNDTTYNNAPIFGSGPGNVFNNYGTFVNRGDMTFAAGSGGEMLLNNYGTVDCQAGYLQISAGGTSSGTLTGAAGSTLEFQASYTYAPSASIDTAGTVTFRDGTHTFAPGQFNPSGPVVVDGNIADVTVNNSFPSTSVTVARGTLTLNASQSLHDLTVSGLVTPSGTVYSGILTGSGDVTVTGTLNWTSGGSMSGTGHTIIDLGAQMSITTPNTSVALSRTLDILGSATWWGYYGISMTGAVINNHGTFTNDTTYNNAPIFGNGPGNVFNNYGTFVNRGYMTFAAGSGGEMLLNNYATVDCQAGYLTLSAGVLTNLNGTTLTGGRFRVAGALDLGGEVHTNNALLELVGPNWNIVSGSLPGIASLAINDEHGEIDLEEGATYAPPVNFVNAGGQVYIDSMSLLGTSQYASSVVDFSTQWSASANSAAQALGSPNVPYYADSSLAWAPSARDGTSEYLMLGFSSHLPAVGVRIRETNGNGFVTRIDLRDTQGAMHIVWTGTDTTPPDVAADFLVTWPATLYQVDAVKIFVDTDHSLSWEEIDAVQLLNTQLGYTYTQNGGSTTVNGVLGRSVDNELGFFNGRGEIAGDLTNSGIVRPGGAQAPGRLRVDGNFTQTAGGSLEIELESSQPGTGYDQLAVAGAATLDGAVHVARLGDAASTAASYAAITYASHSGEFAAVDPVTPDLTSEYRSQSFVVNAQASDLPVNVETNDSQYDPSVAMDAAGNFVVAWASLGQDGSGYGIFARRFDASGQPLDDEDLPVNYYTADFQEQPSVAMDAAGNFVVAWTSYGQNGSGSGIFARRFDASGQPLDDEDLPVNYYTANYQDPPSVAMDAAGNFVVAWTSYGQDGSVDGIFARRFDASSGQWLDDEDLPVNYYTANYQRQPSVAMDAAGNFVVAWMSYGQDGSGDGIFARRFDAGSGQWLDDEDLPVNRYTTDEQYDPSVAMDAAGNFVVAWAGLDQDGFGAEIFARRFDASNGQWLDDEDLPVNRYTAGYQFAPSVAMDAAGNFVVAWTSDGQDGSGYGIFARRFDASGQPLDDEDLPVNYYTADAQRQPSVAMDAAGNFVVAWTSYGQDGSGSGIFARRYSSDTPPTVVATLTSSGQAIGLYDDVQEASDSLTVRFSQPMSEEGGATGLNSVWNPENYHFSDVNYYYGSQPVDSVVSYGFNPDSGYYEAVLSVQHAYAYGYVYNGGFPQLTISSALQSADGVPLDGDRDLQPGGDYELVWHLAIYPAISLSNTTVLEHQPIGTVVGVLPVFESESFGIVDEAGTDYAHFDIEPDDPDYPTEYYLTTRAVFDYAERSQYAVTIYEADGLEFREWTFTIEVLPDGSVPLVAVAGGPYTVDQGETLALDAGGSSGPISSFAWDLDGDGIYETPGPTASFSQLVPGSYTVGLQVGNGDDVATDTATITVLNLPPAAGLTGPAATLLGETTTFTVSASDVAASDSISGAFLFTFDWGDGSPVQTLLVPSGSQVSHVYRAAGSFAVQVAAQDRYLGQGNAELAVEVQPWGLEPNADNPDLFDLVWGGSAGDDDVAFEEADGVIRVHERMRNGVATDDVFDVTGVTGRLIAYGGSGNDVLDARALQLTPATLDGAGGNNTLYGGAAGDVLIGGSDGGEGQQGNNVIVAGDGPNVIYGNGPIGRAGEKGGNNLIVGGAGNDTIYGNFGPGGDGGEGGQNLIVGGGGSDTIYASQPADGGEGGHGSIMLAGTTTLGLPELQSILDEWTSDDDLAVKLSSIEGTTPGGANGANYLQWGVTVFDADDALDDLYSDDDGDANWLFYELAKDVTHRTKASDQTSVLL